MFNQLFYIIAWNYWGVDYAAYFLGRMLKKDLNFNFDIGDSRIIAINVIHEYGNRFSGDADVLYLEANRIGRVHFKINANKYGDISEPYDIDIVGEVDASIYSHNYISKPDRNLIKLAKKGDLNAMCELGVDFYCCKDYKSAFKWFKKAAERGHDKAQYNLGGLYESGEGVTKSSAEASKWYIKAAEQGNTCAQYCLADLYSHGDGVSENPAEAFKWYMKAAEQGYADAQYSVGTIYYFGNGVSKNLAEAYKWYMKAAEQGHARAQTSVGLYHYAGNGIPKNPTEAFKWYMKAAKQGLAEAQYVVGLFYESGDSVPKNSAKAYKWYMKAAEQGLAEAKRELEKFQKE